MRLGGRGVVGAAIVMMATSCGPARAPQDHEPLADGRGGHAGTFNAAGDGNGADANNSSEIGNSQ
jgi:hypothetical protein